MFIYNSLSGKKEELKKPFMWKKLKMFVCGPTVFDHPHIGNFRTFVIFDIIVRYMRSCGFRIFYLQNITDIDDKIIARAEENNEKWEVVSKKYEKEFLHISDSLNIRSVDIYARATEYIPFIIKQIKTLIKKGYAYQIEDDGWYFDLSKFPDYGKLARRTITQAEDGISRIDASEKKKNSGDFCLWKFSHPIRKEKYEPSWNTNIGTGRPGWHIEDTAITEKFFGAQYDLHGGGMDLKFPHHEAEIAQQESASGKKPFVKIWMHTGFLQVNGQKMSKSLGNFITMEDALSKMSADEFRFMILRHHYRAPFNFSEDEIYFAKTNFSQIKDFIARLEFISKKGKKTEMKDIASLEEFKKEFHSAMEDDFNTPEAIAAIQRFMNIIYGHIFDVDASFAKTIKVRFLQCLSSIGFSDFTYVIPENIWARANERELSRAHKQFAHADALRKEIEGLGYEVEDTPLGPFVLKSKNPNLKS